VVRCHEEVLDLRHFAGLRSRRFPPDLTYEDGRKQTLMDFKRAYLTQRLRESGGVVSEAADRSGVRREAFARMLKECGIQRTWYGSDSAHKSVASRSGHQRSPSA